MSFIEDGFATAEFVCSKEKANIFLIGDSIRLGYCATVRETLCEVADVFYIGDNCRNTQYVITSLNEWVNRFDRPDLVNIVQFNCGHWDVAHWNGAEKSLTGTEEYAENIKAIIATLKKKFANAKIVFATTTPMNPDGSVGINPRNNREIDEYNRVAIKVAEEMGIIVNDLNAFTRGWGSECYQDYCHFSPDSFKRLGVEVANRLKNFL